MRLLYLDYYDTFEPSYKTIVLQEIKNSRPIFSHRFDGKYVALHDAGITSFL